MGTRFSLALNGAALCLAALVFPTAALAGDADVFAPSIAVLIKLFMVAFLIESALAVIFRWRVFLALFDGRGWKTVFMVAVSWLVVASFGIDWIEKLIYGFKDAGGAGAQSPPGSQALTTLVLAGGSAGIFNLLVRLGYRAPVTAEEAQPKPPQDKAWLAVKVTRKRAVGEIRVLLEKASPQPSPLPPAMAGVIGAGTAAGEVFGLFFRDRMRFPRSAGHVVDSGAAYTLAVAARDSDGASVASSIDGTYVFAPGAIVDLTVTL